MSSPATLLVRGYADALADEPMAALAALFMDRSHYSLAAWDPAVVGALRQSGAAMLPDPIGYLDAYLAAPPGAPRDPTPAALLGFLDPFYFTRSADPERRARLAALCR